MGSDRIEEMKSIQFPVVMRGYDRYVVDAYISDLREWLESGGEDEARREVIRSEMERVGERTGSVLSDAQRIADELQAETTEAVTAQRAEAGAEVTKLRAEASEEVAKLRADVDEEVAARRKEADEYLQKTRAEADSYAKETRAAADADAREKAEAAAIAASELREEADSYASTTHARADTALADAEAEAARRTKNIEREIAGLVRKRRDVVDNLEQLNAQMKSAIAGGEQDLKLPTRVQDAVDDPNPTQPMQVEFEEETEIAGQKADVADAETRVFDAETEIAADESDVVEPEVVDAETADAGPGAEEPLRVEDDDPDDEQRRARRRAAVDDADPPTDETKLADLL